MNAIQFVGAPAPEGWASSAMWPNEFSTYQPDHVINVTITPTAACVQAQITKDFRTVVRSAPVPDGYTSLLELLMFAAAQVEPWLS